jgi:aspartate/tyrosine/aromatic aminotransferase
LWGDIGPVKEDAVFSLIDEFNQDDNPDKVMLGIGTYRAEQGVPYVFESVKKAEKMMVED